jgi:ABC-type phosphonate transport system ATPase subunit
MSAQEAVEYGLIDRVLNTPQEQDTQMSGWSTMDDRVQA